MRCMRWLVKHAFEVVPGTRLINSFAPQPHSKMALVFLLLSIVLNFSIPNAAYAACSSFNVPDANTMPSTNPMASGGSIDINIGVQCDPFGLNPYPGSNTTSPQHGSVTVDAAAGIVTYTNNGDGATSDSFAVADASGIPFTINVAIAAATSPITVSPASLASAQVGTSYSQTLSATGGTAPYAFALTSGSLPPGLSFGGSTISGTPTQAGNYTATFTVTDNVATTTTKSYTISVPNPSNNIAVATPPAASVNVAYSATLSASGALAPYSFALYVGSTLPPGLSLASNGTISGTPTSAGNYSFQVTVTDSSPNLHGISPGPYFNVVTVALSVQTVPPPVANSVSATVNHGSSANPITLDLTGGAASSVAIATQASHGTASASGTSITYTPTASYSGPDSFTYTATNGAGTSAPATVSLTVSPATISLNPSTLSSGTIAVGYSQAVSASGGTGPYTYAITSGSLPPGLSMSITSGSFSGTPTGAGTYNFVVTATDSSTGTGPFNTSKAYSITIAAPTISVSPSLLSAGTIGTAYSQAITASGGTGSYTFTVTSGAPPAGLTLSSGGTLSGMPTAGGTFNFTVTATDNSTGTGAPFSGSRAYSLVIAAPTIALAPTTLPSAAIAAAYNQTITASGGTASYSYAITAGALPAGLMLSSAGVLDGTPTAGGTFNFTVTATDSSTGTGPFTGSRTYSLSVSAPTIVVNPSSLASGIAETAYNQTLSATGGAGSYTYTLSAGALPPGLALSSTGQLSGIPTAAGTFNFTVAATDSSTGTGPFTGSRAYTITIAAPTIAFTPTTLPAGSAGTAYNQSFTASGGAGSYTYSLSAGALPPGMALSAGGVISGTPSIAGSFNFTIIATDAFGFTGSQAYTLAISAPTITISPATLPAGAAGTAYSQTITASGGTGSYTFSLAAGSLPPGVALASSGSLSGTPTAGGTFNFTVMATDGLSFTGSRAYSVAIGAPTISIAPTTLAAATVAAAYSQTITASGGIAPYTHTITAGTLPAGLTLSSGGVLSGTPTASGTFNFTVTATDSSGGSGPFTGSRAYSLAVSVQSPIAGNVTATVAANSSNNAITLNLSGGTATSVAIATGAGHGTAIASGTSIAYTPAPGYSGSDSFTYTATNGSGTSAPGTVVITVSPPTLSFSPASGALPAGVVGTSYNQIVTASDGTAPYGYAVIGTLPAGLSLNHATGAITGTPTASGNYSFSVSATDANNATTSAAYTITTAPPPTTFVFSPAGGALTEAMAGEAYSQQISTTGGTGVKIYRVASGTLPNGMVLNISTGQLNGTLAAGTQGDYSFSIEVRDGNGATGAAAYTLKVRSQAVSVLDMVINVPAGSAPPDVYLNRGATGGPFTSAALAFVEPAAAGTATIIQGQLAQAGPVTPPVGWYLHYTPNPAYSGQARVGYKLTSALGTSNTGTVTYNLSYDAGKVAEDINGLVHDFVQSRQNMIANTIEVPGLLQRRQMQKATDPITARMTPSQEGMTLGFSTSLSQMRAAGGDADAASAPFNVWISGAFLAHSDKSHGDSTSKWGSFAMINMGADYLLSDKALIGISFHYDRMTDPTDEDAELTGNGWLAGPYASFQLGKGVFWNGSLRYGGSNNTIDTQFWDGDFKTTRWMADTSIEGQWYLDEETTLSPKLRAIYFSETVDDYTVKNGTGDAITIEGFDEEQFRVSLGAEIARSFTLESGAKLTPKLGVTGGFSGLDGSGAFGTVTAGMSLQTASFWMLDTSLLFNIEGDGQKSVGAKVAAAKKF